MTPEQAELILATALPAMRLGTLLFVPLLMATWFAPGLVMFENFPPGAPSGGALGMLEQLAVDPGLQPDPGLVGMVALILPFGLGLLVFVPWTLTSTYAAYQDIFSRSAAGSRTWTSRMMIA
jgi:hypothetical protein